MASYGGTVCAHVIRTPAWAAGLWSRGCRWDGVGISGEGPPGPALGRTAESPPCPSRSAVCGDRTPEPARGRGTESQSGVRASRESDRCDLDRSAEISGRANKTENVNPPSTPTTRTTRTPLAAHTPRSRGRLTYRHSRSPESSPPPPHGRTDRTRRAFSPLRSNQIRSYQCSRAPPSAVCQ